MFIGRVRAIEKLTHTNSYRVRNEVQIVAKSISMSSLDGSSFVLLTAATYSYRNYVRNLACSLSAVGKYELLLIALDEKLHKSRMPPNVHSILLPTTTLSGDNAIRRFGTDEFRDLSRLKLAATKLVLAAGYDVLFTDADVVWCDSAALEIAMYAANTDLVAQDAAVHKFAINTGLYYARSSRATVELFDTALKWAGKGDDQDVMNMLLCEDRFGGERVFLGSPPHKQFHPQYCRWNDTATIGFLPKERFPLGCTKVDEKQLKTFDSQTVRNICKKRRIALYHYSCIKLDEKINTMKNHGMWLYNRGTRNCK